MNENIATDNLGDIMLFNGDCMEWMKVVPDKWYDLAICDPPYQLPKDSSNGRGKLKNRVFNRGNISERWDRKPSKEYFDELFRISKNQIIWGGNYFDSELSTLGLYISISQRYKKCMESRAKALLFTTNSTNKASSLCSPP